MEEDEASPVPGSSRAAARPAKSRAAATRLPRRVGSAWAADAPRPAASTASASRAAFSWLSASAAAAAALAAAALAAATAVAARLASTSALAFQCVASPVAAAAAFSNSIATFRREAASGTALAPLPARPVIASFNRARRRARSVAPRRRATVVCAAAALASAAAASAASRSAEQREASPARAVASDAARFSAAPRARSAAVAAASAAAARAHAAVAAVTASAAAARAAAAASPSLRRAWMRARMASCASSRPPPPPLRRWGRLREARASLRKARVASSPGPAAWKGRRGEVVEAGQSAVGRAACALWLVPPRTAWFVFSSFSLTSSESPPERMVGVGRRKVQRGATPGRTPCPVKSFRRECERTPTTTSPHSAHSLSYCPSPKHALAMKTAAAYLLLQLGGNASPSAGDVTKLLKSGACEMRGACLDAGDKRPAPPPPSPPLSPIAGAPARWQAPSKPRAAPASCLD